MGDLNSTKSELGAKADDGGRPTPTDEQLWEAFFKGNNDSLLDPYDARPSELVAGLWWVWTTGAAEFSKDAAHWKTQAAELLDACKAIALSNKEMAEALREIAKGEGRFSLDPMQHAENTIEDMKEIAVAALAKLKQS